jgi:hypothetical protein
MSFGQNMKAFLRRLLMPHKLRKMNLENLIKDGQKSGIPGGFVAQTANGTATWRGSGHNKQWDYEQPMVEPDPTRPAGRSNRTGE